MNLYIVGGGGFGREVYNWAKECSEWGRQWNFKGFLDDRIKPGQELFENAKVIGSIEDYKPQGSDLLINGLATIEHKVKILKNLDRKNCKFVNMIHPTALIGKNVQLGKGAVICPFSVLTCDIVVGDFCSVNLRCTIGHNVVIGDLMHMNCHSEISGNCRIGDRVLIGGHAFILQNKNVGCDSVIGAGSIVMRSVKKNMTVIGNPARKFISHRLRTK